VTGVTSPVRVFLHVYPPGKTFIITVSYYVNGMGHEHIIGACKFIAQIMILT
jgi:hypothetical protein